MKKNKQKEWEDFQNVIADALWKHTYEVIDRLKDAQKHDSQLVALEIAKVASEIGRLHNKALSQKEEEVRREVYQEVRETLKPSANKLLPIGKVQSDWEKLHTEMGGEVVYDDTTIDNEYPRKRAVRVIYHSPIFDFQEVIKAGQSLTKTK